MYFLALQDHHLGQARAKTMVDRVGNEIIERKPINDGASTRPLVVGHTESAFGFGSRIDCDIQRTN